MTPKDQAELIVRRAFDSWFGESLENMEDEARVRKFFFDPLCCDIKRAIERASKPVDSLTKPNDMGFPK